MDPTAQNFSTFFYPTAIYVRLDDFLHAFPKPLQDLAPERPSLTPVGGGDIATTWSIDGGEANGSQFFAVPDFARGLAPTRVDVFIPEAHLHPSQLRNRLQCDSSMHLASQSVGSSPLSVHLTRALSHWSAKQADFQEQYFKLPLGSRIIVEAVRDDIESISIHMVPTYAIEQQLMSQGQLDGFWGLPSNAWPPVIDITSLQLVAQPYPTVSLVRVREQGSRIFVFKSLPEDLKFLYHEIKVLLHLECHPNLVGRPLFLVTRKSSFGGKKGVCGFILTYYGEETLRDRLTTGKQNQVTRSLQYRWARQVTSALLHIHNSFLGYFANLKLNNIVISSKPDGVVDVVLIDFEQRLGPASWSPPEVHYIAYLARLASCSPDEETRGEYVRLIRLIAPDWKPPVKISRYKNDMDDHCIPWSIFTKIQREKAQVFMLGKLLWCIFERASTLNTIITVDTFREEETDLSFPEFRRTPEPLRACIRDCTAGAMEWEGRRFPVMRKGSRIVSRTTPVQNQGSSHEVSQIMINWWHGEITRAKSFVNVLAAGQGDDGDISRSGHNPILSAAERRPTLRAVQRLLDELSDAHENENSGPNEKL